MRCITGDPARRARLLPFDGGGRRRLLSLQYAKRIETPLRAKTRSPDLVLAEHFGRSRTRDFLCEKGAEHAEEIVKLEHFEND